MKKNKGRSASERLRALKVLTAVMLMLLMVLSGLAPSLYSYAEEGAEAATEQVQNENEVPAEDTDAPSVNEEPAPEPEDIAETPALSDAATHEDAGTQSGGAADSSSAATSGADKAAPSSDEKADEKSADSMKDDEKYPAQSFRGSTSELDIKVDAQEGVFP